MKGKKTKCYQGIIVETKHSKKQFFFFFFFFLKKKKLKSSKSDLRALGAMYARKCSGGD